MSKAHAEIDDLLVFRDAIFLIKKIEAVDAQLFVVMIEVTTPEPDLAIYCLYIASECLSLEPLNTTLTDCCGELNLNNRALFFTAIIVGPIELAIHPCSKAI